MAEETLAWRAIKPGHRVLDAAGNEVGTVTRVLADDGADIFHGIAYRHGLPLVNPEHELLAANVERITSEAVHTSLAPADSTQSRPVAGS